MAFTSLCDPAAKRVPSITAPASFASMCNFRFFLEAVVLAVVVTGAAAEQGQIEEPGVGGQAASCPDTSAHLFTKWTTGGCLGEGDEVTIGGLAPPVVAVGGGGGCGASSLDFVSGPAGRGCVCDFNSETDYFPTKVSPQFSAAWSVEYRKSFKVVDNLEDGVKYVLHLCGTPAPALEGELENATSVEIPIRTVAVLPTVIIPLIEYIGQRESIAVTANANIESHCMAKLAEEGAVEDLTVAGWPSTNYTRLAEVDVDAVFCDSGPYGSCSSVPTNQVAISLSHHTESALFGDVEWAEYVALFYNREAAAHDVVENIEARFRCEEGAVTELVAAQDFVRPKVLWANWYPYPTPGWSLGSCPGSWYCGVVESAGGQLVGAADHPPTESGHSYGYLSDEEFLAGPAKEADVWLYSGTNFLEPDAYFTPAAMQDANASATAAQLKAFKAGRVFDIMGNGAYDWFESRQAMPDILLLDLIDIIHPEMGLDHERVWLRSCVAAIEVEEPTNTTDTTGTTGTSEPAPVQGPAPVDDVKDDGGLSTQTVVGLTVGAVAFAGFAGMALASVLQRSSAKKPGVALASVPQQATAKKTGGSSDPAAVAMV